MRKKANTRTDLIMREAQRRFDAGEPIKLGEIMQKYGSEACGAKPGRRPTPYLDRIARQRARKVDRAIELVWSSLDSHRAAAITSRERRFHQRCVKEYGELLWILGDLY